MSAQAGIIYGRIKRGSIRMFATVGQGEPIGNFIVSVAVGAEQWYDVTIFAVDMPGKNMEGKKVRAMCSDANDRHTLIDLEVVPEPELDDKQGMFAMSLYKKGADGKVAKFEMSRGVIPQDGDVDAFVKFIDKASSLAGVKALGYSEEEDK